MKRLIFQFFIILSGASVFIACNKNNQVAPKPSSDTPQITPYLLDASGTSNLYVGNVIPGPNFGAIGFYYLDIVNGKMYGPKTASGWGSGLSLKGAPGPAGLSSNVAGSKIYLGSTIPAASLGKAGDYYIDKASASAVYLYGPKTASGWGTPLNLRGPAGPTGPTGPVGPKGPATNLVKTDTFTVKGSDWLWNSQYVYETSPGSYTEYFTRYYVRHNTTVTNNVLKNGLVMAFFTPSPVNNPNQWEPLPYQFDSSFGYTYNYVFVSALNQVTLHYFFIQTNNSATLPTLSTYNDETRRFKIVTVVGESGTFMMENHINLNNYEDVAKVTGLWQEDILNQ